MRLRKESMDNKLIPPVSFNFVVGILLQSLTPAFMKKIIYDSAAVLIASKCFKIGDH